jgi:hypothetical protein
MAEAHGPFGSFPDHREGLGQDIVQGLPVGQPILELVRFLPELGIGKGLYLGFEGVDLQDLGLELFDLPFVLTAENLGQYRIEHVSSLLGVIVGERGISIGFLHRGFKAIPPGRLMETKDFRMED